MGIKAISIYKSYPSKYDPKGRITAVKNISIDINEGTKTVIFGPTGSGKTTLISILSGIIQPDKGKLIYEKLTLQESKKSNISSFIIKNFGYIPQKPILIENINVFENILIPHIFTQVEIGEIKNRAIKLINRLDLENKIYSKPYQLSGGEIKKLLFIRAIVKNPKYIFADEPFSELDIESTEKMIEILEEESQKGKAVVITSHRYIKLSGKIDVYRMENGEITEYKENIL